MTDANEAPTGLRLSSSTVVIGSPSGTTVGELIADDVDSNSSLTYSLVSGRGDRDNNLFTIDGNTLKTNADIERRRSFSIRVRVTDEAGNSTERAFRIRVMSRAENSLGSVLEERLSDRLRLLRR